MLAFSEEKKKRFRRENYIVFWCISLFKNVFL